MLDKLVWLLRYHRQHVFDANGDAHHRAILRLKKTQTFKALVRHNQEHHSRLAGERLTRMGY